jgi:hypothetical protein
MAGVVDACQASFGMGHGHVNNQGSQWLVQTIVTKICRLHQPQWNLAVGYLMGSCLGGGFEVARA